MSLIARNSLWFARGSAFAADQMIPPGPGLSHLVNTSPSDSIVQAVANSNVRGVKSFNEYDIQRDSGHSMPSQWDVRGGGWHISRAFNDGALVVACGMQINDAEELEFVRHEYSNAFAYSDTSNAGRGGKQQSVFVIGGALSNVKPTINEFPFLSF
eukprot:gene29483-5830_t